MTMDGALAGVAGAVAIVVLQQAFPFLAGLFRNQSAVASDLTRINTRLDAIDARHEELKSKQTEHDGLLVMVTELRSEMKHVREAVRDQPQVIAQVVAASIKETFAVLGVRRTVNA